MAGSNNLFAGPRGKHFPAPDTVIGHEHSPAREREHEQSQDRGLARASRASKAHGPVPIHGGMHRTQGTTLGAPKTEMLSSIPDASNPNALDPTRAGKKFPIPAVAYGMREHPLGAKFDPSLSGRILAEALSSTDDHAHEVGRHARLPVATAEE